MKIYVGNLSFNTTNEELAQAFAAHGDVQSASIVTDRETGRARGFGFVEMSDADAKVAIEKMNGTELGGRQLTVNEAKPRESRGPGGGGGFGGGRGGGGGGGGFGGGGNRGGGGRRW